MANVCMGYPIIKIYPDGWDGEAIVLNDVLEYHNDMNEILFKTYEFHGDDMKGGIASGNIVIAFGVYDSAMTTANKIGECSEAYRFNSAYNWIGSAKRGDINPFCVKLFLET